MYFIKHDTIVPSKDVENFTCLAIFSEKFSI